MLNRVKANRQAIEYQKVAQELLQLANHDAGDFIDENEDGFITGQQFKVESSGWIRRLDEIIDSLRGSPDPLGLMPRAIQLRQQLQKVTSQPSDDITYDMMHASGNVRQSKQRFWNRISNMFDSITSEEPQILRAQNSGALDVFEQPKTGHLSNVTGMRPSSSKPKQQTSIPKPKQGQTSRGQIDHPKFSRPETTTRPVTHTGATSVVEASPQLRKQESEESGIDEMRHVRQDDNPVALEQKLQTTTSTPNVDNVDEILNAASSAAENLYRDYQKKARTAIEVVDNVTKDATNLKGNLDPLYSILESIVRTGAQKIDSESLMSAFDDFIQEYKGSDLFTFAHSQKFESAYGDRMVGDETFGGLVGDTLNSYTNLQSAKIILGGLISKNAGKDKILEQVHQAYDAAKDLNSRVNILSDDSLIISIVSEFENKDADYYRRLADALQNKDSVASVRYISKKMYPKNLEDANAVRKSVRKLAQNLWGENFESTSSKSLKAFKVKQSNLNSMINFIEDQIETPIEHGKVNQWADHASDLYSTLDHYAAVLEQDRSTSNAAVSVNKLKNKLTKILRNTAAAMEPEFKGDVIRASQNAVQQLELAVENQKPGHLNNVVAMPVNRQQVKPTSIPKKDPKQVSRGRIDHPKFGRPTSSNSANTKPIAPVSKVESEQEKFIKRLAKVAFDLSKEMLEEMQNDKSGPQSLMDMLGDAKQQIGNAKLSIDKNFILYTNQTTGLDTEKNTIASAIAAILMEIESVIHSMEVDIRSEKILEARKTKPIAIYVSDLEDQYAQLDKLSKDFGNPNFKTGDRPKSWYVSVKQIVNNVTMVLDDLVKILTDLAGEYHIYSEEFHHFGEEALSNPESDIIQSFIESYEDLASEQDIREALLERYDIHSTNYKSYVASPVRNYGQKTYTSRLW